MSTLLSSCQWLANTSFSTGIRESTWSYFFRIKAVGLVLALLNAMAFHFGIERRIVDWDTSAVTPRAARFAGALSIALWAAIVITGRFVAYNWFPPLV